jgi:hypothetical protein
VNPYTASFGGQEQAVYRGVNMLEHAILRRLGWTEALKRVLNGESIEVSDTRWVTLFSGEERFVDVNAAPIVVDGKVVGGVACLVDATDKHRGAAMRESKRLQQRELELFLTRDVGRPLGALTTWSKKTASSPDETARAMVAVTELVALVDDLQDFLQLGAYQPKLTRVVVVDVMRAAGSPPRIASTGDGSSIAVMADPRLLRRAFENILRCGGRMGGGRGLVSRSDGRVLIEIEVDGSPPLLQELLGANSLSMMEASGADASLAAARWMIEMIGGTLTVSESSSLLIIDLAGAAVASATVQ